MNQNDFIIIIIFINKNFAKCKKVNIETNKKSQFRDKKKIPISTHIPNVSIFETREL